jgi:hypothetical protein
MTASATPTSAFRKSSYCANDACVEVAFASGEVLVRDGKDPDVPLLHFSTTAWVAFVDGIATGQFDHGA